MAPLRFQDGTIEIEGDEIIVHDTHGVARQSLDHITAVEARHEAPGVATMILSHDNGRFLEFAGCQPPYALDDLMNGLARSRPTIRTGWVAAPVVGPNLALTARISTYAGRGYGVVEQTETSAHLVKPKKLKMELVIPLFLISAVFAELPFVVYLGYFYYVQKDKSVTLSLDANGQVVENHGGVVM